MRHLEDIGRLVDELSERLREPDEERLGALLALTHPADLARALR